jgi:hypothetical protein
MTTSELLASLRFNDSLNGFADPVSVFWHLTSISDAAAASTEHSS